MTVHLKCKNCGGKYYTARSKKRIDEEMKCEKCGAKLSFTDSKKSDGKKLNKDTKSNLTDNFK